MSIDGQGHFFTIYFPGFVCFVLYKATISGERLQDHWSSGLNLKTQSVRYSIELLFKVQISSSNPTSNIILIGIYTLKIILAHLSQRLIGELIVYPCSGVRRCCQPYSNIFSPETTKSWPIKAKFYVEHHWV